MIKWVPKQRYGPLVRGSPPITASAFALSALDNGT